MKRISLILLLFSCNFLVSQRIALVGGTLIDGYGNAPIYDSVILINDETIIDIGTVEINVPRNMKLSVRKECQSCLVYGICMYI